ncbi:hypothetical protein [Micromonospora sp. DT227]|uniref:hypothetical protein n=1 Tax=Micromonospora sp. DT227 TaxID=3393433 RepID=UPI003CEEDB30
MWVQWGAGEFGDDEQRHLWVSRDEIRDRHWRFTDPVKRLVDVDFVTAAVLPPGARVDGAFGDDGLAMQKSALQE